MGCRFPKKYDVGTHITPRIAFRALPSFFPYAVADAPDVLALDATQLRQEPVEMHDVTAVRAFKEVVHILCKQDRVVAGLPAGDHPVRGVGFRSRKLGVAKEIQLLKSLESFEKFCDTGALPDLEPRTLAELKSELFGKFGEENVAIIPKEGAVGVEVEIALPDRTVNTRVKVDPEVANAVEEVKAPPVPFPLALPNDPELVWVLGRRTSARMRLRGRWLKLRRSSG